MAKLIKVDLGVVGLPNEYVTFLDPKFMSWGARKELATKFANIDPTNDNLEMMFLDLCTDWCVSALEGGTPFTGAPTREAMQTVPSVVFEVWAFRLKARAEEGPVSPK